MTNVVTKWHRLSLARYKPRISPVYDIFYHWFSHKLKSFPVENLWCASCEHISDHCLICSMWYKTNRNHISIYHLFTLVFIKVQTKYCLRLLSVWKLMVIYPWQKYDFDLSHQRRKNTVSAFWCITNAWWNIVVITVKYNYRKLKYIKSRPAVSNIEIITPPLWQYPNCSQISIFKL